MRFASAVVLAGAACAVQVDFSGTAYRCGPDRACPNGYLCFDGECRDEFPGGDGAADSTPIDGAVTPDGVADAAGVPWWDPAYLSRQALTIENQASVALAAGYQVGFMVPTNVLGASQASLNDLRVVAWDGAAWTELPRVVDDYTGADPYVWMPTRQDLAAEESRQGVWIYFANAAAPAPTFGQGDVMEWYDGFFGTTVNTTRWTVLGTVAIDASSDLTFAPGSSIRSNVTWGPGYAVDFSLEVPMWSARFWGGFQRSADFTDDQPWLIWISRSGTKIWPEVKCTAAGVPNEVLGTTFDVTTVKTLYGVERYADHVGFRRNDVVVSTLALGSAWADPQQVRLTNESTDDLQVGHVRVRRVVDPAPVVVFGAVENYP
jgi:hypothetical protein